MFFDWNNDGRLDLYVNDQFSANSLFQNVGRPPLVDVAVEANITGSNSASYCASSADLDGDGDLDVLLNNFDEPVSLFINHEGTKRNWLGMRVIGDGPNTAAIGANAEITAGGVAQFSEIYAGGNGYLGQNEQTLHFGLDAATVANTAVVRWPSGGVMRSFTTIPANHRWTIYPPSKLGDADLNGDVDASDRALLCSSLGPVVHGAEMLDFNGDFMIDAADIAAFRVRFEGTGRNWSDVDGDGVVGGSDLAQILGQWDSSNCVADLDGDGVVTAADLSILLGSWG